MNIAKLARSPRAMKALTGLSYPEFVNLVPSFEKALRDMRMERSGRKRALGGGQKGKLKTAEDKLFFILLYLKTYPTFDVLAFFSDKGRGRSCESVHFFQKALERALGRKLALPNRKIRSIEEFAQKFPEVKDVFIDGAERRAQRPRAKQRQNKLYSGKKKGTMRKNIVVSDENRRILILTPTKSGRRHDKRLADKRSIVERLPEGIGVWTDTGFRGIERVHDQVVLPTRASKNHPLTLAQKEENRLIAGFRVLAEHAIGGIKRLRSVTDVYRNKKANFDDHLMLLAAGLWNYRLQQA